MSKSVVRFLIDKTISIGDSGNNKLYKAGSVYEVSETRKNYLLSQNKKYIEVLEDGKYDKSKIKEVTIVDENGVEVKDEVVEKKYKDVPSSNNPAVKPSMDPRVGEAIAKYSTDSTIIKFVKSKFPRLNRTGAIKLIKHLITNNSEVRIVDLQKGWKSFVQKNMAKVTTQEEDATLKPEVFNEAKELLFAHIIKTDRDIAFYNDEDKVERIKEACGVEEGVNVFKIVKSDTYEKVRQLIGEEGGDLIMRYDFEKPDIKETHLPKNTSTLQRIRLHVVSTSVEFNYPVLYHYKCIECGQKTKFFAHDVVSTSTKIKCKGVMSFIDSEGNDKSKICNTVLTPDDAISEKTSAYYYQINVYNRKMEMSSAEAVAFDDLMPGYYDAVVFEINKSNKTRFFQIVDVKPVDFVDFKLPVKKEKEHYALTLINAIDSFVDTQANCNIFGMLPIKIAMLCQAVCSFTDMQKTMNIKIVGDASTGKSMIAKKWGFLMYGHEALATSASSVSIPALRGTPLTINLMGKDVRIVSLGFFGTHRLLAIDEAGENKELVQQLKAYLLEANYDYSKAGGDGVPRVRTAMGFVTQNVNLAHIGQYIATIRKKYRDENFSLEGVGAKPDWEEDKAPFNDLFQPLYAYASNPHLMKIIAQHRLDLEAKQEWWIDGYEHAVHERFPFYFYLTQPEGDFPELDEAIMKNDDREEVTEVSELMQRLYSKNLVDYFKSLKPLLNASKNDSEYYKKIKDMLSEYGEKPDTRTKRFFNAILKISRMLNGRDVTTDEDLEFVRYVYEHTNRKVDLKQCVRYETTGSKMISAGRKTAQQLLLKKDNSSKFGVDESTFNN